jgi:hypothetical protein
MPSIVVLRLVHSGDYLERIVQSTVRAKNKSKSKHEFKNKTNHELWQHATIIHSDREGTEEDDEDSDDQIMLGDDENSSDEEQEQEDPHVKRKKRKRKGQSKGKSSKGKSKDKSKEDDRDIHSNEENEGNKSKKSPTSYKKQVYRHSSDEIPGFIRGQPGGGSVVPPKNFKCTHCGSTEHSSRSCDNKSCGWCGKNGHTIRRCPAKEQGLEPINNEERKELALKKTATNGGSEAEMLLNTMESGLGGSNRDRKSVV